jgi:archaellum component FlaC
VERQRNPKKFIRDLKQYYEEPREERLSFCYEVARQGPNSEIKNQLEKINEAISQMKKDIDDMKGNKRHQNAKCFYCHEMGHIRPNCPRLRNKASNRVNQSN